jgi:predicted ester cyclase
LVEDLLRAWNARDLDRFTSLLTEDIYWHDLGMIHPPAIGRTAVRQFSESVLYAFPDFRYELRGPLCIAEDGSAALVPWTISATNLGIIEPPGLAPTHRTVTFSGLDYLVFRDGLVSRIETRFDPAEAVEQMLGLQLRPTPGSFREKCFVFFQRVWASWLRRKAARRPSKDRTG